MSVKHPVVVNFERETGCECVTRLGHPFAEVEDDGKPHKLASSNEYERASGEPMKCYRGAPLNTAALADAIDRAEVAAVQAETAKDAAVAAKVAAEAAKVG